jgi:pimeloyl-ACP methyl ester carboxylesterase
MRSRPSTCHRAGKGARNRSWPHERKATEMRTLEWTFDGTWPYQPRWFDTPDGRLHYVDEGPREGPPVVMVHGNPTWGYLYRHFIPPLVHAGHRVIVLDLLGAGRSDKPDRPEVYTIRQHAERTERLLESLDLRDATLVPHDWGMHSLWWAVHHPERLRGLFILNTIAHRRREQIKLPLAIKLFRYRGTGPFLVKRLDLVRRFLLFRFGIAHRERLTPQIRRAYLAPNPTVASRTGVLVFLREIPTGPGDRVSHFWGELEDGLERHFRDKPVGIAWGMKDAAFTPAVLEELWLGTFPHAVVTRLPDAGHFVQEDAYERVVPALLDHLASASSSFGRVPAHRATN